MQHPEPRNAPAPDGVTTNPCPTPAIPTRATHRSPHSDRGAVPDPSPVPGFDQRAVRVHRSGRRRLPRMVAAGLALAAVAGMPSAASAQASPCGRVVAVGDSVMAGAAQSLAGRGVNVDARVSRQFSAGAPLAAQAAGGARAVIVHLGTNGPMSYEQLDRLATQVTAQGARLVLVTVQLPNVSRYGYERDVNSRIWGVWKKRWGVKVADWNSLSSANTSLLAGDGIHLSGGAAARAFADLVTTVACRA